MLKPTCFIGQNCFNNVIQMLKSYCITYAGGRVMTAWAGGDFW